MPLAAIILVLLSAATHATWNLFAHSQQTVSGTLFLRCHIIAGLAVLLPELVAEWQGDHFSLLVWGTILISGIIHSTYYLGLTMGYRHGNFTVVYPMSRALPMLFLAGFDVFRGQEPSLLGWLGIILVLLGCGIAPLKSLQKVHFSDYWNWATVWVFVIVLATVAYTAIDKIAVEVLLPTNVAESARYELLQALFTVPCLWFVLRLIDEKPEHEPNIVQITNQNSSEVSLTPKASFLANWQPAIAFSCFVFGSYWFMLWAYQFSSHVSYLVALRQMSIIIGVIIGVFILREPSPKLRIIAAILITLGTLCIAQTPA